jgi:hypothetical protein
LQSHNKAPEQVQFSDISISFNAVKYNRMQITDQTSRCSILSITMNYLMSFLSEQEEIWHSHALCKRFLLLASRNESQDTLKSF